MQYIYKEAIGNKTDRYVFLCLKTYCQQCLLVSEQAGIFLSMHTSNFVIWCCSLCYFLSICFECITPALDISAGIGSLTDAIGNKLNSN